MPCWVCKVRLCVTVTTARAQAFLTLNFVSLFFHTTSKRGIFLTFSTLYSVTAISQCEQSSDTHLSAVHLSYYCSLFVKVTDRNKVTTLKKISLFGNLKFICTFGRFHRMTRFPKDMEGTSKRRGPLIYISVILTDFTCDLEKTAMDITLFQYNYGTLYSIRSK